MKYEIYFQYGETEKDRDFLKKVDTLKEAIKFRMEQIQLEGWNINNPTEQSYVAQYKIVEVDD